MIQPSVTRAPATGRSIPRASAVEDNDWLRLPVAGLGELDADLPVTVIVPARDPQHLDRLVAGLEYQSYPTELFECLVVDDQSDPPISVPETSDLSVRVVTTSGPGFGAGRARNVGAAAARGSILIFLDADVVPNRRLVEAHARWHHATGDAVVVGGLRMADVHGIPGLTEALREDRADEVLDDLPWDPVAWSEVARERSSHLTARRADTWVTVVGANVSVRRESFDRIGGFTEFGIRGIEDTEFGAKAFLDGAVLVPDVDAFGWHPTARHFSDPDAAARSKRRRGQLFEQHVPLPPARSERHRAAVAPRVTVHIDVSADGVEEVVACVESILRDNGDAVIVLSGTVDHPDATLLAEAFTADGRIRREEEGPGPFSVERSAVHVLLRRPVTFVSRGLPTLMSPAVRNLAGRVSTADEDATAIAVSSRAWNRAARLAGRPDGTPPQHDDEVLALVDRWFGSRLAAPDEVLAEPPVTPDGFPLAASKVTPRSPALRRSELRALSEAQMAHDAQSLTEAELRKRVQALEAEVTRLRGRRVLARAKAKLRRLARGD